MKEILTKADLKKLADDLRATEEQGQAAGHAVPSMQMPSATLGKLLDTIDVLGEAAELADIVADKAVLGTKNHGDWKFRRTCGCELCAALLKQHELLRSLHSLGYFL